MTVICATCFTLRALIVGWSALDKQNADLDVWQHPLLDIIYYTLVEIVPSALVLFILRCSLAPRPGLPRPAPAPAPTSPASARQQSAAVSYYMLEPHCHLWTRVAVVAVLYEVWCICGLARARGPPCRASCDRCMTARILTAKSRVQDASVRVRAGPPAVPLEHDDTERGVTLIFKRPCHATASCRKGL